MFEWLAGRCAWRRALLAGFRLDARCSSDQYPHASTHSQNTHQTHQQLVEVINEDYADYVSLSTRLVNVDGAVVRMRRPLLDIKVCGVIWGCGAVKVGWGGLLVARWRLGNVDGAVVRMRRPLVDIKVWRTKAMCSVYGGVGCWWRNGGWDGAVMHMCRPLLDIKAGGDGRCPQPEALQNIQNTVLAF